MQIIRNKRYVTIINYLCIAAILTMIIIGITVYGASLLDAIICFLFYLLYVQIPGILIHRVAGIKYEHISTLIVTGSFIGWVLCIALVYATSIIHTNLILMALGPLASFYYITLIYSKKWERLFIGKVKISKISSFFHVFFVLALLFCLIGSQYQFLAPPKGNSVFISGDRAYHMGLANAISHFLPAESLWIKGVEIKYHIFSDVLLSIPIRLFGVRADVAVQFFSPLLTAFLVSTSIYAFFREMSRIPNRAGIYSIIFMLSSMFIVRRWSSSLAFKFIFTNDNYAGYAIAASLVFLIAFKKWYADYLQSSRGKLPNFLVCVALVALIAGIKGPVAAVLIVALWGMAILGIAMRKISLRFLIPISILTIAFIVVFATVLGSVGGVNSAGGATIAFAHITDISFWKKPLIRILKSHGIPSPIRMFIVLATFAMFFFTAFLIPFSLGYFRELVLVVTGKKEYNPPIILIYAAAMVGFVALFVFGFKGHNEVYFGLVTVILVPIISFWFIEDLELDYGRSLIAKRMLHFTKTIMIISLILCTASLTYYYVRRGTSAIGYANQSIAHSKYGAISREEYEAMTWIRENTDKDAVLANDRYYSVSPEEYTVENRWDNTFFIYEIYANRFSYISGSGYDLDQLGKEVRIERLEKNRMLYDEKNTMRGDLARELGVDYVIVSKRFSGELKLENKDYKLCFSNRDIDLYQVLK